MITDVKKEIGKRLAKARKEWLKITIKELAQKTKTLSAQRISNWEQGTRSPGPMEAKLLGEHLNVSPAYLLCLSDNPLRALNHTEQIETFSIPIFTLSHYLPTHHDRLDSNDELVVSKKQNAKISAHCVALIIDDDSMAPMLKPKDIIVIDNKHPIHPGHHVVCYHQKKEKVLLRQYREDEQAIYKLSAYNSLWSDLTVINSDTVKVLGVVIEHRSYLY